MKFFKNGNKRFTAVNDVNGGSDFFIQITIIDKVKTLQHGTNYNVIADCERLDAPITKDQFFEQLLSLMESYEIVLDFFAQE